MVNSIASAQRPTATIEESTPGITPFHDPVANTQADRVAIMAARYAAGQDIWGRGPLTGLASYEQVQRIDADEEE